MIQELAEPIDRLFSLTFSGDMPLETRKVALSDLAQSVAHASGDKLAGEPGVEYPWRLKLFLLLRLLGENEQSSLQLLLLSQCEKEGNLQRTGRTIELIDQLAQRQDATGQFLEALSLLEAAVALGEAVEGPQFSERANLCTNQATVLFHAKRYAEAERMRRLELSLRQALSGPENVGLSILCEEGLADAIAEQGRLEEASELYMKVCRMFQKHEMYMNGPAMGRIQVKIQHCMRV